MSFNFSEFCMIEKLLMPMLQQAIVHLNIRRINKWVKQKPTEGKCTPEIVADDFIRHTLVRRGVWFSIYLFTFVIK